MGTGGGDKVFCDVGFHVAPGWRLADDRQEVEHEFGDGVGCSGIRGLHMGEVQSRGDIVTVVVSCAEGVGEPAEVEPVAEEMFQHGHAGGAAVLEHDDGDAGRRHPGDEPFKVCEPLLSRNVVEGVGTEDEIALSLWTGG